MRKTLVKAMAIAIISLASWTTTDAGFGGGGYSYADSRFWIADSDRNGYLDRKEAQSPYALGLGRVFDKVDKDHDGKVYLPVFRDFVNIRRCQLLKDVC